MALRSIDQHVSNLLLNRSFLVPSNQRKYVWNQNNWRELVEDLDLVVERRKPEHFIGSIVLKTELIDDGIREHYSIIDGQQRVITLTILVAAVGFLYAEKGAYDLFSGLTRYILVRDINGVDYPIVSLQANQDVYRLVAGLVEEAGLSNSAGKYICPAEEICRRYRIPKVIKECFLFFCEELKNRTSGNVNKLISYMKSIEDIRYIDVNASTEEDAYAIFEVLNARGQELTDFDLLRNFILKNSNDFKNEAVEIINKIEFELEANVDYFLKHYVLHKYGIKSKKGKDDRPYKIIAQKEKTDIKSFLIDLELKAGYYYRLLSFAGCNDVETKVFTFFKRRNQRQFRPLILGLMHMKDIDVLGLDDYNEIIMYLYRFFVCFNVIGEQKSNKIDDIVEGYSYDIENSFAPGLLDKLKESLEKRMPNEESFINGYKALFYSKHWKAYSGSRRQQKVFAVLEYYEQLLGNNNDIDPEIYNIEHCLSDSDSENNAFIGNLLLLEKDFNRAIKNIEIDKKVNWYMKSKLFEPINVANQITNGEFNPRKRAEDMASYIYRSFKRTRR